MSETMSEFWWQNCSETVVSNGTFPNYVDNLFMKKEFWQPRMWEQDLEVCLERQHENQICIFLQKELAPRKNEVWESHWPTFPDRIKRPNNPTRHTLPFFHKYHR